MWTAMLRARHSRPHGRAVVNYLYYTPQRHLFPGQGGAHHQTARPREAPRSRRRAGCSLRDAAYRGKRPAIAFRAGLLILPGPSVPIPKFAPSAAPSDANFRIKGTLATLILVRSLDLKFLHERGAIMIGTSNPPH